MAMSEDIFALITGASSGIGKAMADECASRNMNVLLVALDEPALYRTTAQLKAKYGVAVDCLGIDLRESEAPAEVYAWCREKGYRVNTLINNAGFGRGGWFDDIPVEEYTSMMQLNNQAMVGLAYHFLPELKRHPKAFMLNMSSMEATLPLPYKTVYTGTKNFVYAFSLALREELKTSNVRVSVLCPGPVLTNEDGLARLEAQGNRGKLLLMMPDEVAAIAIPRMLRGQRVIIPGRLPYLIVKMLHFFPLGWKMSLLERIFRVYRTETAGSRQ